MTFLKNDAGNLIGREKEGKIAQAVSDGLRCEYAVERRGARSGKPERTVRPSEK